MSLIPLLLDNDYYDPWEMLQYHPYRRKRKLSPWDHFGVGVRPTKIRLMSFHPSKHHKNQEENFDDGIVQIVGKDGYQVHLDVQHFKPNEVKVKTIDDFIVVEGKHDEREDEYGHITRHFIRKYKLPEGFDINQVTSTLSSDGILTVKAPSPEKSLNKGNEKTIQIQHTGPAHLNVKENEVENTPKKTKTKKT